MRGWEEFQIGDIVTFQRGHDLPKSIMEHGIYPVAGSNSIIGHHSKFTCKAPGITIGRSGNIGNPMLHKSDFWAHNTTLYVKEFKKADPTFFYYLLKTLDFSQLNSGSAVPSLNRNFINPYKVKIPPLPTQKAIAEILSSLDDKIELNNQINQNLEALAQALFKQWFVDFEFPNGNGEPYKSSGGEMIDSELGEIPKGWSVGEFGELVKIVNGFAFKSKDFQEFGDSAIIKIKNISGNLVDVENTQFIPNSVAFSTNQKFQIKEGEILIAMTGAEVGKIGITPKSLKRLFLNQRVGKLLPILLNTEMFIYTFFNTFNLTEEVKSRALGSAQPNISSSGIESIKCIIPLSNVIFEFEKCVGNFYPMLLKNWNENKSLSNLRDILLPKLISGELEVSEASLEPTF